MKVDLGLTAKIESLSAFQAPEPAPWSVKAKYCSVADAAIHQQCSSQWPGGAVCLKHRATERLAKITHFLLSELVS